MLRLSVSTSTRLDSANSTNRLIPSRKMIKVNAILIVLISVKLTYVREHREIHRDKIAPYSLLSLLTLRE